jgi:hypothetical protein
VADGDAALGRAPLLIRWRVRVGPWHLWLAALVALGLGIRLGYVVGWSGPGRQTGDAIYYHVGANLLADGDGFLHPLTVAFAYREMPGADHPPAYSRRRRVRGQAHRREWHRPDRRGPGRRPPDIVDA